MLYHGILNISSSHLHISMLLLRSAQLTKAISVKLFCFSYEGSRVQLVGLIANFASLQGYKNGSQFLSDISLLVLAKPSMTE